MIDRDIVHSNITSQGHTHILEIISTREQLSIVLEDSCEDRVIEVVFDNVRGFRVLDESDLMEFWPLCSSPEGWIFEINKGGWLDIESTRKGFAPKNIRSIGIEYLITGIDDCINVIALSPPNIITRERPV